MLLFTSVENENFEGTEDNPISLDSITEEKAKIPAEISISKVTKKKRKPSKIISIGKPSKSRKHANTTTRKNSLSKKSIRLPTKTRSKKQIRSSPRRRSPKRVPKKYVQTKSGQNRNLEADNSVLRRDIARVTKFFKNFSAARN